MAQLHNKWPQGLSETLKRYTTNEGKNLEELQQKQKVYLFFMRHLGCTFCRQMLDDLASQRHQLAPNTLPIIVHMGPRQQLRELLHTYHLDDLQDIQDKSQDLYRAFTLKKGTFSQLFGWQVWKRALREGSLFRYGFHQPQGDVFQMPGAFLIYQNEVLSSFEPQDISEHLNVSNT